MKRPGGVCDLQKGERYSNMDYIMVTSVIVLGLSLLRTFIISYDIACQWSKALFSRLAKINKDVPLLHPDSQTRFAVPKFHLPAHIPNCQTRFTFMFTPGAGLCDGEAPERGWAESNPLGPSTREMGPGTRRDTIDLNFGDYNWRHVMTLDTSLLKKMEVAVWGVAERVLAHRKFEEGLKEKNPAQVSQWLTDVIAWENDPVSVANPFDMTITTPSQCAVRRALADEEEVQRKAGKSFSLSVDMSPSQLIARGLDLEAEMRGLKYDLKQTWDHSRDRELTKVQLKSNTIVRKVDTWYRHLQLYIPSSIVLREEYASTAKKMVKPYDLPLWLPSQIGRRAPVPEYLTRLEYRLRTAQALDALTTIRRNLQRRVTVWDLKDRWLRGQGANTRALNLISTLQRKIQTAKEEYIQARTAILVLAPILGEKNADNVFLPLADSDLVSLTPESVTAAPSQGQTKQVKKSWIWNHPGVYDDNLTAYESEMLKIEWAKSRARANRYKEEILIVREGMKRTLRFFAWKEGQWHRRATARKEDPSETPLSPEHAEGLVAYAARQASICRRLSAKCDSKWLHVDRMILMAEKEVENPALLIARQDRERKKAEERNVASRTKGKHNGNKHVLPRNTGLSQRGERVTDDIEGMPLTVGAVLPSVFPSEHTAFLDELVAQPGQLSFHRVSSAHAADSQLSCTFPAELGWLQLAQAGSGLTTAGALGWGGLWGVWVLASSSTADSTSPPLGVSNVASMRIGRAGGTAAFPPPFAGVDVEEVEGLAKEEGEENDASEEEDEVEGVRTNPCSFTSTTTGLAPKKILFSLRSWVLLASWSIALIEGGLLVNWTPAHTPSNMPLLYTLASRHFLCFPTTSLHNRALAQSRSHSRLGSSPSFTGLETGVLVAEGSEEEGEGERRTAHPRSQSQTTSPRSFAVLYLLNSSRSSLVNPSLRPCSFTGMSERVAGRPGFLKKP
ncbi:hypothetical protein NMY22_g19659 [Coprinellus aureogranulatus]|nr:hypothetical protein NMY22_g19659 [Coprinellus aureogranulatus]